MVTVHQGHMRKSVAKGARDVGRPWGKPNCTGMMEFLHLTDTQRKMVGSLLSG